MDYIDTTANGYLLTPENCIKLVEAGLDKINISRGRVSDEMFWDITKTKVSFTKLRRYGSDFYV